MFRSAQIAIWAYDAATGLQPRKKVLKLASFLLAIRIRIFIPLN
jgi:hypothetical protein